MNKPKTSYKQGYIIGLIDLAEREYYKRCKENGVLHPISFKSMMLGYTIIVILFVAFMMYMIITNYKY